MIPLTYITDSQMAVNLLFSVLLLCLHMDMSRGLCGLVRTARLPIKLYGKLDSNDPVLVYGSSDKLKQAVCADFIHNANQAISQKGSFYAAIPGGSVLKMLAGMACLL
jgi:hypothetical protein